MPVLEVRPHHDSGLGGCRSVELLASLDQDERLTIVEVWDGVAAHQAAAQAIPVTKLQEAMALLAAPAMGTYFRPVNEDAE